MATAQGYRKLGFHGRGTRAPAEGGLRILSPRRSADSLYIRRASQGVKAALAMWRYTVSGKRDGSDVSKILVLVSE